MFAVKLTEILIVIEVLRSIKKITWTKRDICFQILWLIDNYSEFVFQQRLNVSIKEISTFLKFFYTFLSSLLRNFSEEATR